jgi:hypothetical protein
MVDLLTLILIGTLGYIVFYIIKLPSAAMIGPMISIVAAFFMGIKIVTFDSRLLFILQSLLGVYIGISVNRENLKQIKKLSKPAILMVIWTFFISFGLGFVLIKFKGVEPVTAFLSTSPAGVSEMSMLAVSVGADITIVSIFQLSRLIITMLVVVPIFLKMHGIDTEKEGYISGVKRRAKYIKNSFFRKNIYEDKKPKNHKYIYTLIIGLIGSFVADTLGVPGGPLIGAIFLIAAVSLSGVYLHPVPQKYKKYIMIGVGISVGTSIVNNQDVSVGDYLFYLTLFVVIMFSTAYLLSRVIKKITGWDELTCLLATAPAGITPITVLAYSHDCKALEVVMIQLTRFLTVKAVIWPIIMIIV